jgi:hypothetical protein
VRIDNDLHEVNNSWNSARPQNQHHSPKWRIMDNNNQTCDKYLLYIPHGSIPMIGVGSKG